MNANSVRLLARLGTSTAAPGACTEGIKKMVKSSDIVIFMKGTPGKPQVQFAVNIAHDTLALCLVRI